MKPEFAPFYILIAMTKRIHEVLYPINDKYAWIVSGFDLKWNKLKAGNEGTLVVRSSGSIKGEFTRSSVEIDDFKLGHLIFTKVKKS